MYVTIAMFVQLLDQMTKKWPNQHYTSQAEMLKFKFSMRLNYSVE